MPSSGVFPNRLLIAAGSATGLARAPENKKSWGGRRDSNPQQPEPQSGALPLSYDHHNLSETDLRFPIALCKQRARLFPRTPLIVSVGGPESSPQPVECGAAPSRYAMLGGLFRGLIFVPRSERRRGAAK